MGGIIRAAVKTIAAKTLGGKGAGKEVINPLTHRLMDKIDNLKFLSYVDKDGYPVITPVIQAQTTGGDRIIFASSVYRKDLKAVTQGTEVALFCMSLEMQMVLLRGVFKGYTTVGGVECGSIDVNWIYNPMPPSQGRVYPEQKLEAVSVF